MLRPINDIFSHLDEWRHFPNYQLERRADIFFSLYLGSFFEARLKRPFLSTVIPEFPIKLLQRQIDATDGEIDALVYELYGLTAEEIAVIEAAIK